MRLLAYCLTAAILSAPALAQTAPPVRVVPADKAQVQYSYAPIVKRATPEAKIIIFLLLIFSIVAWYKMIFKIIQMRRAKKLNQFFTELTQAHPHPLRGGKQPRILFAAQVSVGPPTFALFTTGFLEAGYRRFIERRLREDFGFAGTPIRIVMRVREKRSRR